MKITLAIAALIGWGGAVVLSLVFIGYIGILIFGRWYERIMEGLLPKPEALRPGCFGQFLTGAPEAERDCHTCYYQGACTARTRFTAQQRARDAERTSPGDPFIPVSLRRPD